MPLTAFQKAVVRLIATNRNAESHVADGAVINRDDAWLRYSDGLDIFHDAAESIAKSTAADERSLERAGYSVKWVTRIEGLCRAEVSRGGERVRLDWTTDSAFRFFPIQADLDFGYCLHRADLATNKVLALVGRSEIRDFLDILQLDRNYLSLGALVWAACGKDQGYTPALILDQTNRHARYQESDLKSENLAHSVDLRQLKRQWISARARAESLFDRLPPKKFGCLYVDNKNQPITPNPDDSGFATLTRHFGSHRGAWPKISSGS